MPLSGDTQRPDMMRIVLIGAGNLATHLGLALHQAGHEVLQVFSRTQESAHALAARVGGEAVTEINGLRQDADIYICALKDAVLPQLLPQLCKGRESGVFFHTAGSLPLSVFEGYARHYGVLYPMQTFSKKREVDFSIIPCFIEADCDATLETIAALARSISNNVRSLSSEQRKYLHLSAVFACNFANHCYDLAGTLLEDNGLPFDVLLPLIDETAQKVHSLTPRDAQTGPAVRYDENVINAQQRLLEDWPRMQEIYELMSKSIHEKATDK